MHTTLFDQFPREIVCRHAIRLPVDADRAWALVGNFGEARIGAESSTGSTSRAAAWARSSPARRLQPSAGGSVLARSSIARA